LKLLIVIKSLNAWSINSKVHLEARKATNSQGNTEQKEQHWKYYNTWLQTVLQSNNNKNSMVLAQKQTWRPVEQNRGPRYEAMQLCPPDFWQRCQKHTIEKRQHFQQMLGKLDICNMQKTETRSMFFTLYKYQFKVNQRS
jgi:hypothetical protein